MNPSLTIQSTDRLIERALAASKLLAIEWWNWEIDKIKDNLDLILSENIELFIDRHLPIA
jgi:hypothetical protein